MTPRPSVKSIISALLPLTSLSAWASLMLYYYFTQQLNSLLHPLFRPLTLAAGILMIVLILVRLKEYYESGEEALVCGDRCRDTAQITPAKIMGTFILVLPVLICLQYEPRTFSLQTIKNRGVEISARSVSPDSATGDASISSEEANSIITPGETYETDVVELLLLADEPEARKSLENHRIALLVQVVYPESLDKPGNAGVIYGVRLFMNCCAADARPTGVAIKGTLPKGMKEMDWARVEGVLRYRMVAGRLTPEVEALSLTPAPAPAEHFLY